MMAVNVFAIAFEALRRNLLRSALTSLGIIIGVAAVIVMMALGAGARASIASRIQSLGTDVITVNAGSATVGGVRTGQGAVTTLTTEDAVAIREEVSGVRAVAPQLGARTQVVAVRGNWQTQVQGSTETIPDIRAWAVETGTFFDQEHVARAATVAVLGAVVRDQLFGAGVDPVGQIVRLNQQPFRVIGVMARKGQQAMGQDQDDTVFVPVTTVQKRLQGVTHVSSILVALAPQADASAASAEIAAVLRRRHGIQPGAADDFTLRTPQEMAAVLTSTTDTMTYLLASVAAVSLIVGGIGIMNIMLVSVTERTKEIGLRRAVGARRRDVLRQFMVEAMALSLAGGLLGVAAGLAAAYGVTSILGWAAIVSTPAIFVSFGFAAAIGMIFGYFPARRAAALNPTDALHYE
ncbi:MAG: ABC transporter permease [Vicinamibacterales bacterium]|nr:ABC transporter permease [Vicinamibacterales bacterium]